MGGLGTWGTRGTRVTRGTWGTAEMDEVGCLGLRLVGNALSLSLSFPRSLNINVYIYTSMYICAYCFLLHRLALLKGPPHGQDIGEWGEKRSLLWDQSAWVPPNLGSHRQPL
jgi:hypothetical protein